MAAAADRLGLWRRHLGRVPLLSEFALSGEDPQPSAVVPLERASTHRAEDEDEPPVVGHEARDGMHAPHSRAPARAMPIRAGWQPRSWRSVSEEGSTGTADVAGARPAEESPPLGWGEERRGPMGGGGFPRGCGAARQERALDAVPAGRTAVAALDPGRGDLAGVGAAGGAVHW